MQLVVWWEQGAPGWWSAIVVLAWYVTLAMGNPSSTPSGPVPAPRMHAANNHVMAVAVLSNKALQQLL